MPSNTDLSTALRLALAMALAACFAGCTAVPASAPAAAAPAPVVAVVEAAPPPPAPPPAPEAPVLVLAYADQLRGLQGPELTQEIARFTDVSTPEDQMRLALALIQTRQLYDLVRAQELLQRVLANTGSRARPLHPLARLLAARFAEQRRVEDQLDRQGQQLRDAQRRLEQTNDKLEALREIERSLTARPGTATAPATKSRPRVATP